jgi:GNAT superfamily N-acetyltransferase
MHNKPIAMPVTPQQVDAYAALLARGFGEEERFSMALTEVLDSPDSRKAFMLAASRNDIEAYAQAGCAWGVEGQGIVLADVDGLFTKERADQQWQSTLERACAGLTPEQRAAVLARERLLSEAHVCNWWELYPQGCGRIDGICVAREHRGSGVFGALINPLIATCAERGIPLCLETFAPHLVEIYAHKGFEVIRSQNIESLGLTEWDMAKLP